MYFNLLHLKAEYKLSSLGSSYKKLNFYYLSAYCSCYLPSSFLLGSLRFYTEVYWYLGVATKMWWLSVLKHKVTHKYKVYSAKIIKEGFCYHKHQGYVTVLALEHNSKYLGVG